MVIHYKNFNQVYFPDRDVVCEEFFINTYLLRIYVKYDIVFDYTYLSSHIMLLLHFMAY